MRGSELALPGQCYGLGWEHCVLGAAESSQWRPLPAQESTNQGFWPFYDDWEQSQGEMPWWGSSWYPSHNSPTLAPADPKDLGPVLILFEDGAWWGWVGFLEIESEGPRESPNHQSFVLGYLKHKLQQA